MSSAVAIVCAHDEAATVAETVTALAAACDPIFVVDDGSTDATGSRARDAGARVVTLARNRGKGAALRRGIEEAIENGAPMLLCDGDLGASAANVLALLKPVQAGEADLAIAAPPPSRASGIGAVESLARMGIKALTGRAFKRPLSGQRALTPELARALTIAPRFGVETAMTIDAIRAGFRVIEIGCAFTHAKTGRDLAGFVHRGRQAADVAAVLLRRSLQRPASEGKVHA
jgi:glycosyltransferase involved in cell wall biosynthesis